MAKVSTTLVLVLVLVIVLLLATMATYGRIMEDEDEEQSSTAFQLYERIPHCEKLLTRICNQSDDDHDQKQHHRPCYLSDVGDCCDELATLDVLERCMAFLIVVKLHERSVNPLEVEKLRRG